MILYCSQVHVQRPGYFVRRERMCCVIRSRICDSISESFLKNTCSKSYHYLLFRLYSRKMSKLTEKSSAKCFGGYQKVFSHISETTKCEMRFAIFLPPQASNKKLPVIYFLAGLSMDHITFIDKSGSQRYACEQGVILVAPDSSPHDAGIPGEKEKWNYGRKASHYIDAIELPWSNHYKMFSYLSKELPNIINENFPVLADKQSIIGHSIGGYGAFLLTLRNPNMFLSTSALAPVCNPHSASHSIEAFERYLGKDRTKWDEWSIIRLAQNYKGRPLKFLIDQGTADEFLEHLNTKDFLDACKKSSSITVTHNSHDDYDHHYCFVRTFIEEHIKFHAQFY